MPSVPSVRSSITAIPNVRSIHPNSRSIYPNSPPTITAGIGSGGSIIPSGGSIFNLLTFYIISIIISYVLITSICAYHNQYHLIQQQLMITINMDLKHHQV